MTARSSNGWTNTSPSRAASIIACAIASASVSPCSTTSAPQPAVRVIFDTGVPCGMTITDRMPSRLA